MRRSAESLRRGGAAPAEAQRGGAGARRGPLRRGADRRAGDHEREPLRAVPGAEPDDGPGPHCDPNVVTVLADNGVRGLQARRRRLGRRRGAAGRARR